MKRIGIIGAMEEEISKLKQMMENVEIKEKASMEFNVGILNGKETVVVRSGIGKVNAGICTQILVDDFQVEGIINTGIAGSLKNEINIGDIVISTDALQHDVDAREFGYEPGQIPRMDVLAFKADERMIDQAEKSSRAVNPEVGVFKGRVVSGDQFIADRAVKENIIEKFQGFCTEMEGAAIAQAAYLNHVPFVVIRSISDKADDSASVDYPAFEKKAIENGVRLVSHMVSML
ncbi:MAG: 5'-methylthioadenosine/adenosylhomocysteine nucleosidase [Ruminococcus sp.]|jgi:adenosylhomocysteine nucleosidase